MEESRSLARHCLDGICHCDWRLTVSGCAESSAIRAVYISHIVLSALTILPGLGIMISRMGSVTWRLWYLSPTRSGGQLRPRPIEGGLVLLLFYNALRVLGASYLLADVAPDLMIARTFLFEFGWEFGYGAIIVYLSSIAKTIAQSRDLTATRLFSSFTVDVIGSTLLFLPFILNTSIVIPTGAIATSNLRAAEKLTLVLYALWFVYTVGLALAIIYVSVKITRIMRCKAHRTSTHTSTTYMWKVQATVSLCIISMCGYALILLLYGIFRVKIVMNPVANVVLQAIWLTWGTSLSLLAHIVVIIRPSSIPTLFSAKSRTNPEASYMGNEGSITTQDYNICGGTTISAITTRFVNDNDAIWNAIQEANKVEIPNKSNSTRGERHGSGSSSQIELASAC